MRRLVFACLLALMPAHAQAQEVPGAIAREAVAMLESAANRLSEAESARDRVKALTATVQAYERGLAAMREGLRQAALEERAMRAELADRDVELARLLAVLQGIERDAPDARTLHPGGPLPAIRAGMIASAVVPAINARAQELAGDLADLNAVVAIRTAGQEQLEAGVQGIRDARLKLTQAVSNRTDLPGAVATDDAAMEALINSAETLAAFAETFATESPWANILEESWPMPVEGTLLRDFDETDAAGIARPGWVVATDPAAIVVAPVDATVRFSGQMPDFGGVLILEPRAGEMLILAGIGALYPRRGQIIAAGDPLGVMPGEMTQSQEILIDSAADGGQRGRETLYIEFRHGTEAIDPATRFGRRAE